MTDVGPQRRTSGDPLAPLLDVPGLTEAADAARVALGKVHRHRANVRKWPVTAAESAVRGARSSSALDGGGVDIASAGEDPVLAGALRVAQAVEGGTTNIVGSWRRAPLQALARLHSLAAADLVGEEELGRPAHRPEVAARLDLMTRLVTGTTTVPAPILAGVAHGELLALSAFGSADGVVARGVSRLVTIACGLDPHGLGVPEVYWLRRAEDYKSAADGFASGSPEAVGSWLIMCCRALEDGAREALSIAEAAG